MEKKSIGKFIAVLRKSKGMTQQDVADRLNVSNKAVSRWERDECAPDLSVIPALAEMFEVTCDELLKGERISAPPLEVSSSKSEKQINNYVSKAISKLKSSLFISLAISVVGLVFMFGISYGFYRPVIGFAVMILFEISSLVVTALSIIKAKDSRDDNELFEKADESLINKFNKTLGDLSFRSIFSVLSSVVLALPLVIIRDDYVESVITIESYLLSYFWFLALVLFLLYVSFEKLFFQWIVYGSPLKKDDSLADVKDNMSIIQLSLDALSSLSFAVSPYFFKETSVFNLGDFIACLGLAFVLANIVVFLIYLFKHKEKGEINLIRGIRNVLLSIPSFVIASSSVVFYGGGSYSKTTVLWKEKYLFLAAVLAITIFLVFSVIESIIKNKKQQ